MERRLAAILVADVVGYSALTGKDEEGTLAALKEMRSDIVEPLIAEHHGRLVKLMGDGFLVEFQSAVDAVRCALAWQTAVTHQSFNEDFKFRIAVNLGDIVIDGDDILGDGVNVAARLEGLANPGGIVVSDMVYQNVRTKLDLAFDDDGLHSLKNIETAVRVWKWTGDASVQRDRKSPATLADKPSIAVLPFDNMSGDADQEFLADGITEDLITALSKIRWFLVIARHSSFSYKGKTVSAAKVAEELGVRYVLEGSVRKARQRVRITVQLIDTATDSTVWAERYDRDIEDIFSLQDEMTQTIVSAVDSEIGFAERERASRKPPGNLDAWETYQRGLWHLWRFDPSDVTESIRLFRRASKLDENFAPAYAYEAYAHFVNAIQGYVESTPENLEKALQAAKQAVELDGKDAIAHFALGRVYTIRGQHDAAIAALEEAIALNPNLAQAHHGLGWALELSGQLDKAVEAFSVAIRLSPRDPRVWATMAFMALAFILKEDFQEAAEWALRASHVPNDTGYWSAATLAAAQANMGKVEEAKNTIKEALSRKPDLSLTYVRRALLFKDQDILSPYLHGLRLAGIPE